MPGLTNWYSTDLTGSGGPGTGLTGWAGTGLPGWGGICSTGCGGTGLTGWCGGGTGSTTSIGCEGVPPDSEYTCTWSIT